MADLTGLNEVVRDLRGAAIRVQVEVPKVVEKGAVNVKTEARQLATGHKGFPQYPQSITYDLSNRSGVVEAEIGPELGGQGSLGGIVEEGTATKPPTPHLGPAFDHETPRFTKALEDLERDALP